MDLSARLHDLLGNAICDLLQGDCKATLHRVVYDATQATGRIESFSVTGERELPAAEAAALCASLLDDATWRWDLITRHLAVPEILFELASGDRRALFVLDRRGGKLGFLRDAQIYARDFDPDSPGIHTIYELVNPRHSETEREGN